MVLINIFIQKSIESKRHLTSDIVPDLTLLYNIHCITWSELTSNALYSGGWGLHQLTIHNH